MIGQAFSGMPHMIGSYATYDWASLFRYATYDRAGSTLLAWPSLCRETSPYALRGHYCNSLSSPATPLQQFCRKSWIPLQPFFYNSSSYLVLVAAHLSAQRVKLACKWSLITTIRKHLELRVGPHRIASFGPLHYYVAELVLHICFHSL